MSFKFKCSFKITKEFVMKILHHTEHQYESENIQHLFDNDKTFFNRLKTAWEDKLNENYVYNNRVIDFNIDQDPRAILAITLDDVLYELLNVDT